MKSKPPAVPSTAEQAGYYDPIFFTTLGSVAIGPEQGRGVVSDSRGHEMDQHAGCEPILQKPGRHRQGPRSDRARQLEAYLRVESLTDWLRQAMGNSRTAEFLHHMGLAAGGGLGMLAGEHFGAEHGGSCSRRRSGCDD
jgi:hypothetical protein